jgi:hypothetical protein
MLVISKTLEDCDYNLKQTVSTLRLFLEEGPPQKPSAQPVVIHPSPSAELLQVKKTQLNLTIRILCLHTNAASAKVP